jgi:ABC-2 type transport system permease protein
MKQSFLIARQEFIKYVTRRGFLISILMFPLWIMIVILVPQWTNGGAGAGPQIFTVVDPSGNWREAVLGALQRDSEGRQLAALSHYAAAYVDADALRRRAPGVAAMLADPSASKARRTYHALGGMLPVLTAMKPALKPDARAFDPVPPRFLYEEPPARLVAARGAPPAIRQALNDDRDGERAGLKLDAVVVVPPSFGANGAASVQVWSHTDAGLRDFVGDALTQALRFEALRKAAPQLRDPAMLDVAVGVDARDPVQASDGNSGMDAAVPIALAIILFVVSVMNASVLLQGVVEEKSTRMIEVLLSCATPREITTGKLIGVIAVALTTLLIWGLALFALMAIASHDTAALVLHSLAATASLQTLPLLLVYFLCGLLIYGSLFLAIGSMANSLADAQSLLGPSMLILMAPNLMISGVMHAPNGALASTLSWVPIYTPFFMMLRIASHPPVWQVWGTLALAIATAALLILWTGRVFANNVLTTERPPSLGRLIGRLIPKRR